MESGEIVEDVDDTKVFASSPSLYFIPSFVLVTPIVHMYQPNDPLPPPPPPFHNLTNYCYSSVPVEIVLSAAPTHLS
jgi:hypothetical protein